MTNTRSNPIPATWVADGLVSADAAVAFDAFEACDTRALALMVGLPATIEVGSDRYAATVVRATKCTLVVQWAHSGREMSFRSTRGGMWKNSTRYLAVGIARDYTDPSF